MRLIKNSGNDRVVDELRKCLGSKSSLDIASPEFSLFAFAELQDVLANVGQVRLALPSSDRSDWAVLGNETDRASRNRLQTQWLAKQCANWVAKKAEVKQASSSIPQSAIVIRSNLGVPNHVITGTSSFSTSGLGLTPSHQLSLIQSTESAEECMLLASWFDGLWASLSATGNAKADMLAKLNELATHRPPSVIYYLTLYQLFKDLGDELDEEKIIKSATGIKNSVVWKKLYKFQRDGVVGAIDKLELLAPIQY